ncbi:hypothetical protein ACB092_12G095900 [Castanea dentata]
MLYGLAVSSNRRGSKILTGLFLKHKDVYSENRNTKLKLRLKRKIECIERKREAEKMRAKINSHPFYIYNISENICNFIDFPKALLLSSALCTEHDMMRWHCKLNPKI